MHHLTQLKNIGMNTIEIKVSKYRRKQTDIETKRNETIKILYLMFPVNHAGVECDLLPADTALQDNYFGV